MRKTTRMKKIMRKNSDYISISSQTLGSNQYKSTSGITLENVKNEDLLSSHQQNADNTYITLYQQSIRKQ